MAQQQDKVKPATKGKTKPPKVVAAELGIDAKKLRRILRTLYGTHHERWELDATMIARVKKELKK